MIRDEAHHPEHRTPRPHMGWTLERDDDSSPAPRPVVLAVAPVSPRRGRGRDRVREARRPSEAATARVRAHAGGSRGLSARPMRRRRLRREVRLALFVMGALLPAVLAVALLRGLGPSKRLGVVAAARPPEVSLTFDTAGLGVLGVPEMRVVLPGYLLPDDGTEESSHHAGR